MVSKYVIEHLKSQSKEVGVDFDYAFINCQLIDTSYRLYAFLCDSVGKDVPKTGLATGDIFDTFVEGLEERKIHMTIVLDEIDILLKKAGEPLYILTRINSDLKNSSISIIGITNRIDFKESIDARIRSTLTEQEIIFPPYTANQLQDILEERSRTGFVDNVVEKGAISRASALAASEHGDARRALDLLRVAGEVAESSQDKRVTADHVKQASEVIERKIVKEVLTSLPIHSQLVVLAITKLSFQYRKTNTKDPLVTGETYEEYVRICRRLNFDPLTQRRVGDLISELDLLGLISATVVSKGRYGRTRIIKLSVHGLEIRKGLEKNSLISDLLNEYLDPVFDF